MRSSVMEIMENSPSDRLTP
jgi:hypothetical protein